MSLPYRTDRRPKPQPIRGVLAVRDISNLQFAGMIGRSPQWVSTVLKGWVNPSESLMQDSSRVLDVPVEELFWPGGSDGF
jgi:hypothetical protein